VKISRILTSAAALAAAILAPIILYRTAAVVSPPRAEAAAAADPAIAGDTIKWVWTVPIEGYRAAALSPNGQYIGLISNFAPGVSTEKLSLWHWQGHPDKPLWSRAAPGASLVAVGAGGQSVLSCARMDPLKPDLSLRKGEDGAQLAQQRLDGAVWDLETSADGQYAAVTTGGHGLYLFPLDERNDFNHATLCGIGNTVSLAANHTYLAAGTWDSSGVTCRTMSGTPVWQFPKPDDAQACAAAADRVFEAMIAQDGHYVLGLSYENAHKSDVSLYLWRSDGDGTPLWVHPLGVDSYSPKALISKDGRYVAVTYVRMIARGDQSIPEHRLLVLDGDGETVWEKGNLLFKPTLVALAPDGSRVTVSDGQKTLYNLNLQGRVTLIYPLKTDATIRETFATPNGRYLLIYTSDGLLNLYQTG
jgi:hypothetical protein